MWSVGVEVEGKLVRMGESAVTTVSTNAHSGVPDEHGSYWGVMICREGGVPSRFCISYDCTRRASQVS